MQKVPNSLSSNTSAGDWFTAPADMRLTDAGLKAVKKEGGEGETLLENFAARGDKFGVSNFLRKQTRADGQVSPIRSQCSRGGWSKSTR